MWPFYLAHNESFFFLFIDYNVVLDLLRYLLFEHQKKFSILKTPVQKKLSELINGLKNHLKMWLLSIHRGVNLFKNSFYVLI